MTKPRKVWSSIAFLSIVMLGASLFQIACAAQLNNSQNLPGGDQHTATPIKHVIVIIGENHTFDNIFGTFQPLNGQKVFNLMSQGIVTCSGNLGPNAQLAAQQQATDPTIYSLAPEKTGPYASLPQPNTTAALGQPQDVPDPRFPANLPNGPYQITRYVPYLNSYVGDPLHRFYQMWQEQDKGKHDLYTWVHETAGDDNGAHPLKPIHQGALDMGYYNICMGDAPDFNFIGKNYAISDNYHQPVMGGTGANHIMLGTGDAAYYQDAHGNPVTPPANQIENPNPKSGTDNNYAQDGYTGGSYSECSDPNQPGVGPILDYLHSLPYQPFRDGDCAPGAYYLLNNYLPGYTPSGQLTTGTPYAVPPQKFPTIADELSAHQISWKYYGQGYNNGKVSPTFCTICDPFQYATSIMTTSLRNNIQDLSQFQQDVGHNTLPAVSFIKPDGINDGHPASSSLSLFEVFASNIVNEVMSKPDVFKSTAIFITFDEGGGYYDSGYIQPLTFFGDGPRIPMMVVSPYAKQGFVDHTYYDHVSILKFIERNWHLSPLSKRSLDNLPNPETSEDNPYVPTNGPAIGDLMHLFDFNHLRTNTPHLPQQSAATPGKLFTSRGISKQRYWRDFTPLSRELMRIGDRISTRQVTSGVRLTTEVIHTAAGRDLVYILDVDLTSPNIRLGVVQAHNRLISPDSTLTSMANSTGAVAGINGDYFEIYGSGVPIGEEVINEHLLHSPNPHYLAVLGVTSAGRLTIGPEVFTGSVVDGKASHTLFSLNHYSEWYNGRLLLFNSDLGEPVYVGGDPVAMIQPVADSPGSYIVRSVKSSVTRLPTLSKRDALLGAGEAGSWLVRTLHVGDHIRITTSISPDPHLFQAIGGGPVVVKNGALFYDPHPPAPGEVYQRNALTAVGVSRDGTHAFLVVFDGSPSDPVGSRGLTYFEAAHFMLALGCYNAMLLDSGRSSEMVARLHGHHRVSIINRPSDGSESPLANGFFIYSNG